MIALCDKCFPDWAKHEIYATRPLTGCAQCGWSPFAPARKIHLFPKDPRPKADDTKRTDR